MLHDTGAHEHTHDAMRCDEGGGATPHHEGGDPPHFDGPSHDEGGTPSTASASSECTAEGGGVIESPQKEAAHCEDETKTSLRCEDEALDLLCHELMRYEVPTPKSTKTPQPDRKSGG